MRFISSLAALVLLVIAAALPPARADEPMFLDPRAVAAMERFAATWQKTRAATYRIVKAERLRSGKVVREELAIKLQKQPGRVYVRMISPIEGREIIYDRAGNRSKLTVHPGHFPDLTLHLPIHGMLATQNQHHTIEDLGFDQSLSVFQTALATAKARPYGERLEYWGHAVFDGRPVERIAMLVGKRPARREVAREDESLFAFAKRVGADPYVIYDANEGIRSLTSDLEGGERYLVPPYYAERCESWHDRETGMPLKQVMWNGNSLYESYEHHELVLDPKLTDLDFDPDNPAYDF